MKRLVVPCVILATVLLWSEVQGVDRQYFPDECQDLRRTMNYCGCLWTDRNGFESWIFPQHMPEDYCRAHADRRGYGIPFWHWPEEKPADLIISDRLRKLIRDLIR